MLLFCLTTALGSHKSQCADSTQAHQRHPQGHLAVVPSLGHVVLRLLGILRFVGCLGLVGPLSGEAIHRLGELLYSSVHGLLVVLSEGLIG